MLSLTEMAVTLEEADGYASSRGYVQWVGANDVKTTALRRGQDYIASLYNLYWKLAFANSDPPLLVKYSIIEAALREVTAPGSLTPDYVETAQVTKETKQVGPLMKSLEYATSSGAASSRPRIALIDGMLRGLTGAAAGSANFAVTRA